MLLSDGQIAAYASAAGFTGNDLSIAVAVCLAESGGRTNATNHNSDGSTDYGLWQINSVHADLLSQGSWSDPADNARMAHAVWQSSGWGAWTTYKSGAYFVYIVRGRAAATASGNAPVSFGSDALGIGSDGGVTAGAPYKVNRTSNGYWEIIIGPRHYPNIGSGNSASDPIPNFAVTRMAKWLKPMAGSDQAPNADGASATWLAGKHDSQQKYEVTIQYAQTYKEPATTGVIPGSGALNPLATLIKFFEFILNPANIIRVAEFLLGAVLLLIALYKMGVSVPIPKAVK